MNALLEMARSPLATPGQLASLAQGADEVRAAVASNPVAPSAMLKELCDRFAPQVLSNPNLPVLLLAEPFFFASLPMKSALVVLWQTPLDEGVLGSLSWHQDQLVRMRAALHRSASQTLLRRLSSDTSAFVRRAVGARQDCPADVLQALATDREAVVRVSVANGAACPAELLEALARDDDASVRAVAAARRSR